MSRPALPPSSCGPAHTHRPLHLQGLRLHAPHRTHQRGVSLIEILISLALGLVLVGAAAGLYLTNHQTFRQVENLARINENARLAFELLGRDLREAGGIACGARLPVARVVSETNPVQWWNAWGNGLQGFDDAQVLPARAFGAGAGERVANTDAVIVWSSTLGPAAGISSHDATNARFTASSANHGFSLGDIALACDMSRAAIFQITAVAGVSLDHAQAGTPGNCRANLGLSSLPPHNCSTTGSVYAFAAGGLLARLQAHAWYIGNNGRGGTSLYRVALVNAAGVTEEMIENVSNMQLLYLLRTGPDPDDLGSSYVAATTVGNWSSVQAVRLELTYQSADRVGAGGAQITRTLPFVVDLRNRPLQ